MGDYKRNRRQRSAYVVHHEFESQDDPGQEGCSKEEEAHEVHADVGAALGPNVKDGIDESRTEEVRRLPAREAVEMTGSVETLEREVRAKFRVARVQERAGRTKSMEAPKM